MKLNDDLNKLLALIISLTFGLYGEIEIIKNEIINALYAIKNNEELTNHIIIMNKLKEIHLSSCLICSNPCGNSSNYYLNELDDIERINKYNSFINFINNLNDSTDIREIALNISKLKY